MAGRRQAPAASRQSALLGENYRHTGATRLNNPPAAIAAAAPKRTYAYSPRPDPVMEFDASRGEALRWLLEKAKSEPWSHRCPRAGGGRE